MLPRERERIQERLIRAGYLRHRVERMKPWTLLDCLKLVRSQQKAGLSPEYLPYIEPSYVNTSLLTQVWEETVIKKSRSKMSGGYS